MKLIRVGREMQWVASIEGYAGAELLAELPKGRSPGDFSWDEEKGDLVETLEQRRRQLWKKAEAARVALEAEGKHDVVQRLRDRIFDEAATREGLSRVRLPKTWGA